ncbi:cation diffusion facilitator family transporter [Staphylococcus auricularis]|uniref:cation diffusion facilitator family transporter n=1 Tax=Staphylococcus auricularis TaxID=29379 RepID=UPI003EBA53C3
MTTMSNHQHHHMHQHVHTDNKTILAISFIIILSFTIVEIIGGFLSNSLALMSDGLHIVSDTVSLGVALVAFYFSEKRVTFHKTFGYKRFEILAALFNGVTLFIVGIIIIIEAIQRFIEPEEVQSIEMFLISLIGLIVNIVVAWLMFKSGDTDHNINMRGAFIHVMGDLLGSVGAMIAAMGIWLTGWNFLDPIISIIVSLLILHSSWGIIAASINVLMEGTPEDVSIKQVIHAIKSEPQVTHVHDCHVWTISNGINAVSCHAVIDPRLTVEACDAILKSIEHKLAKRNIQHMTIQLETANHDHGDETFCSVINNTKHAHHHH